MFFTWESLKNYNYPRNVNLSLSGRYSPFYELWKDNTNNRWQKLVFDWWIKLWIWIQWPVLIFSIWICAEFLYDGSDYFNFFSSFTYIKTVFKIWIRDHMWRNKRKLKHRWMMGIYIFLQLEVKFVVWFYFFMIWKFFLQDILHNILYFIQSLIVTINGSIW